jgi:hypothetical protein
MERVPFHMSWMAMCDFRLLRFGNISIRKMFPYRPSLSKADRFYSSWSLMTRLLSYGRLWNRSPLGRMRSRLACLRKCTTPLTHIKFDLAEIWKGKFLNAQGTWFDRSAPPAVPLGSDRVLLPFTSFYSRNPNQQFVPIDINRLRFHGYRLDSQRIPIFRYSVDGFSIEDSIRLDSEQALIRQFKVSDADTSNTSEVRSVWLLLSDNVVQIDKETASTRSSLELQIPAGVEHQRIQHGETSDWMILLSGQKAVEVHYRW